MRQTFRRFAVLTALAVVATPLAFAAEVEAVNAQATAAAAMQITQTRVEPVQAPSFTYEVVCRDASGNVRWTEKVHNLVTTVGKNDLLDKYFKGSTYTAAWYMGLAGTGTKAVGDTLASHAGWSEVTPYSGNRPAITFGTTSAGSNTATAVSYSINATATVAGAFVASVNTGTSGTLYSVSDFSGSRSVVSGDTLSVTLTVSD